MQNISKSLVIQYSHGCCILKVLKYTVPDCFNSNGITEFLKNLKTNTDTKHLQISILSNNNILYKIIIIISWLYNISLENNYRIFNLVH